MIPSGASRLDRMIARLTAQRAWLEHAATLIADLPGPVLEIGLGKGRTFSHLRKLLPDRAIYAFDRTVRAPADSAPEDDHLFLGDFRDTLAAARRRLPPAALAHADFGSEDRAHDLDQAAWLGPLIAPLMARGGIVLSDRPLRAEQWRALDRGPALDWPYYAARSG